MADHADWHTPSPAVATASVLTEAWARRCSGGTVIAGVGVWPLLAILAASADAEARWKLEAAVGMPAATGFAATAGILQLLRSADAGRAALGILVEPQLPVLPAWQASVPDDL
jgi:hypothetical protein